MAICSSSCAPTLPVSYTGGCGIVSRPGGIKRLWFVKCDAADWDYSDDTEWNTAQTTLEVVGSGLLMGQKAKGSFTKKRIASCMPEGIVGAEKQITFQDYNTDTVTPSGQKCKAYEFWNTIHFSRTRTTMPCFAIPPNSKIIHMLCLYLKYCI